MTTPEYQQPAIPTRGNPRRDYCWQQNALYDLFQPIIGATGHLVYTNLTRKAFDPSFRYSVRELAAKTGLSRTTVSREIAVLTHLSLVRVSVGRGSRASKIELVDLEELASGLHANRDRRIGELTLPEQTTERFHAEVAAMRRRLQGKPNRELQEPTSHREPSANVAALAPDSKRDASGTPERHQRHSRETQTGVQQIKENRRQENSLSPTPFHSGDSWESKDVPDESKAGLSLKDARDLFCGVMNDLKHHLVDPSRPQLSHLDDGLEDWQRFGFESLGVVEVRESGGSVRLVLCASDPAAAEAGLAKYRKTWDAKVRRWFGREVDIEWQTGAND